MNIRKLLVAATVMSFVALPAMAQKSSTDGKATKETATSKGKSGGGSHHYSGGPKSEPHHIGPKEESTGSKAKSAGGSHHYSGGPKSDLPHHIGPKKDQ